MRIVILGAAGDGSVVAEAVRDIAEVNADVELLGFLDDGVTTGHIPHGLPVLGGLADWCRMDLDVRFITALHKVKQMARRVQLIEQLGIPPDRWATIIHPTARIARGVPVGPGTFIGQYVVAQPGSSIGAHASVRAGANIGHDASLGNFAYMGPNSTLCGLSILEQAAHLGPNAVVVDGIRVGEYAVVGVASAVTKNVPSRQIVFGMPAVHVGWVDSLS